MSGLRSASEKGFSAVLVAMLMLPLLGFASLVVDVGYWYSRGADIQKAADAAALAGVVHLPDVIEAKTVALEAAKRNGFEDGVDGVTVTVSPVSGSDTRLRVTILEEDVTMFFADLFIGEVGIERTALAEFARSIPMGNPENRLGNDPEQGIVNDFYLQVSGTDEQKENGDQFATKRCGSSSTTYCSKGSTGNLNASGGEFRDEGYLYAVRVAEKTASPLVIEIYDAAANYSGSGFECDDSSMLPDDYFDGSNPDAEDLLDGDLAALFPDDGDDDNERLDHWEQRYANEPGAPYCTGDTSESSSKTQVTTYIVRAPDDTPWDNLDNPVVAVGNCDPLQFDGWTPNRVSALLGSNRNYYDLLERVGSSNATIGAAAEEFALQFRRYYRICEVPAANVEVGDYIVQIRTNAAKGDPLDYDANVDSGARNMFSIRAGFDTGGDYPDGSGVELFALGAMSIGSNVPGADVVFDLARITPEYAGQTLEIDLFDVGDAGGSGELELRPPTDSNIDSFTGCQFSNTKSGWSDGNQYDCAADFSSTYMNGQVLTALLEVPPDYTCDASDPAGCYVTVYVSWPFSTDVHDITTWAASLANDPLRLIE